ncbi:short chain amide porin [Persephonella hydrogeniphila]|uniref:Short chain amide porin n=1 Tax=Persephonella hydrogeniphila TaxID=198703 RepID=A0A285NHF7_9AQUI|nr:porin [Persephonella hydrogeniphila]SNZ08875.1 short chain amide porin [Persephonella hydrogeniphila]
MKKLAVKTLIPAVMATSIFSSPANAVAKFKINDESSVWISLLLQLRGEWIEDGQVDGSGWRSDFYIRRARILFGGNLTKNVDFFVETDNPNMGKDKVIEDGTKKIIKSNNDTKTFIQDAWIRLKFAKEFNLVFGQILLPFSHNNATGATSLLGLDYNLTVVKFPPTSNFVWRDYGAEVMGLVKLPTGSLDYRIGLFDGVESLNDTGTGVSINKDDNYRITGRIQYNLFDSEGFYYKGTYLGKKKIVSVGAGIDYQKDAAADDYDNPTRVDDYKAWTVDLFIDYPLASGDVATFEAGYIDYDYGNLHPNDGTAIYAQAGYLFNKKIGIGKIEPIIRYQSFDSSISGNDITDYYLGLAYWIDGFRANLKAEYKIDDRDGKDQDTLYLQAQILF